MDTRSIQLAVATPFSLKATALSHGWHECSPMSWCEVGRCLQIIERRRDDAFRVSVIEGRRTRGKVTLDVTIEGPEIDDAFVDVVDQRLRVVLGLDRNMAAFHAICKNHPVLHVIPKIGAGRGIRSACMGENIVKALCATNVNWTQAVKMINRIGQLGPCVSNFRNLNAWPTPREILRAGEKYLLEVCRVGYRAESILAFCKDVCDKRFDPDELDELARSPDVSSDDLLDRLRSIRGIGPSSAHYLLSFLGRQDRLSIDSATVAHVARTHTNGRKPTSKKIEQVYAKYGEWKQSVWWYEHWLTWGTAKQILRESSVDKALRRRRSSA